MTECERIVNAGIVPLEFLKDETICETLVPSVIKKVWAISIDLYFELRRVCEKHHLKLFTDGGTTLGAVRHQGFIPWDDDMDFCLLREDYDKLKSLHDEFSNPYFLQTPETDKEYGYSYMKLCNSNTTTILRPFVNAKYNHGICIDIFPIDKVHLSDYEENRNEIDKIIRVNSAFMRRDVTNPVPRDIEMINSLSAHVSLQENWAKIENIASKYQNQDCDYLSLIVSTQYAPKNKIWPSRVFADSIEMPFLDFTVPVPIGWDEQMQIYFGDYMQYPPIEKRNTWHTAEYEPDVPYLKYYEEHYWNNK